MKLGDNGEAFFVEENENMEVMTNITDLLSASHFKNLFLKIHFKFFYRFSFLLRSRLICAPPRYPLRSQRERRGPLRAPPSAGLAPAGRSGGGDASAPTVTTKKRPAPRRTREKVTTLNKRAFLQKSSPHHCSSGKSSSSKGCFSDEVTL